MTDAFASPTPSPAAVPTAERIGRDALVQRYELSASGLLNRLRALGIAPNHAGKQVFYTADQLLILDALDSYLKHGGTLKAVAADPDAWYTRWHAQTAGLGYTLPATPEPEDASERGEEADTVATLPPLPPPPSVLFPHHTTSPDSALLAHLATQVATLRAQLPKGTATSTPPAGEPAAHALPLSGDPADRATFFAPQHYLEEAADKHWWLSHAQLCRLLSCAPDDLAATDTIERLGFRFTHHGTEQTPGDWLVAKLPPTALKKRSAHPPKPEAPASLPDTARTSTTEDSHAQTQH